jgi:WD40 repeat protein
VSKQIKGNGIEAIIEGGIVQGVVGASSVLIENLNFYGSALPGQPPQKVDETTIPQCPYPGLAYFGPKDCGLFFGREAAITPLKARVLDNALTALVGASGSGKSSVVLAGLAPRLHAQGGWRFSHFRVGAELDNNPFFALARALVPLLGYYGTIDQLEEVQRLAARLENGSLGLPNVLSACQAANPGKRILLIADQFEEVFTLVGEEALRSKFIDALLTGFNDRTGRPRDSCLVLTLRADFYGMALRHRQLADALQGRLENLGPMTRDELRDAIVKPAGVVSFEDGLVDTLLDDVTSRPGSLPLLQFALREMWGRLSKRCMTRATYDAIGGVEGALAQRAQAIFENLTKEGGDTHAVMLFRRLFTRLVGLGEGVEDTRRTVGRDELGQEAWALAQRLAGEDNRLIVTSAPVPDRETAEVVHEALIRNWPTLIEWVNRDRAFQSWLRQLKIRVDEWRKEPEDDGTLLRGGPLAAAEDWLARRGDELNDEERDYIEASIGLRDAASKRRWLVATSVIFALAAFAIVSTVTLYVAEIQRTAALISQSRFLAREARSATARGDSSLGATLALAALPHKTGANRPFVADAEYSLREAAANQRLRSVLKGHKDQVFYAAFSPGGNRVVTASRDGSARIWDVHSGHEIATLSHGAEVYSAVFSSDGKRIVTASQDRTARIWDADTHEQIAELRGHGGPIYYASFSPDDRTVVTASADLTARVWEVRTGAQITKLVGHKDRVYYAKFSPHGFRIVTASVDGIVRVWDSQTGNMVGEIPNRAAIYGLDFSRDGTRILTASEDKIARIWDAGTMKQVGVLRGHTEAVRSVAFSPGGKRIVTASWDKTARIWDAETGVEQAVLRGHQDWVRSAAFSPNGLQILTASGDGTARLWDVKLRAEEDYESKINFAAYSPNGKMLAGAFEDGRIRIRDLETTRDSVLATTGGEVYSVRFSPDSKSIVTASAAGGAQLWRLETSTLIGQLQKQTNDVSYATFSPDGRWVLITSKDTSVRIWDVDTGALITALRSPAVVHFAEFSPDGTHIVTAGADWKARLWQIQKQAGRISLAAGISLEGHEDEVLSSVYSPDGKFIVTASKDKTARVWNAVTGKQMFVLRDHPHWVNFADVSPDGTQVATVSDKAIFLWNANTGHLILTLRGHQHEVKSVTFSRDGSRLLSASTNKTIRVWRLPLSCGPLIEAASSDQQREFSTDERERYFLDAEPDGWQMRLYSALRPLLGWALPRAGDVCQ